MRTSANISPGSSTIIRCAIPKSARSRSTTCASRASWCAIRRRSRPTSCSAPMTGCGAGACWRRPHRRSRSSTWTCSATRISRPNNGMPATWRLRLCAPLAAAALLAAAFLPARATDPVADFYAGKTLRVMVGFAPGGGYDLYARTLGRYLGRHLPGEPSVVVQNMPGAGSLKVVNWLANAAPRDGTVIATFARGIVFEPLLGHTEGTQFDAPRLTVIGTVSTGVAVSAPTARTVTKTGPDMLPKPFKTGASGAGADSDIFPIVLRNLFPLPMKLVSGYQGGAEMVLAMQRHEID